MLNSRLENMKQSAYLDYFKSFSTNANDTLKRLQQQFKQQIQSSFQTSSTSSCRHSSQSILKKIRTLLSSYEILIYQINDSCEFVQIPQFGLCLVRIFLQVMSVIKFLLKRIIQKRDQHHQQHMQVGEECRHQHQQYAEKMKFQRIYPGSSSPQKFKHGTVIHQPNNHPQQSHQSPNSQQNSNNITLPIPYETNQKQIYKQKQQSKFMMHTLKQQLSLLEMQQCENRQFSKKQLKQLIEGKQRLQAIQTSQNQNILTETLNSFCKKGQHLKNFVTVRQAAMMNNMKQSMVGNNGVLKVKDIFDDDSTNKLNNASIKLQSLFKYHVQNYIKQKQQQMSSFQCQVSIDDTIQQLKLQQNKQIKKLTQIIKKLQDNIEFQRQKTMSLENLLKTKSEQYEVKMMEYRVAKIDMDNLKVKMEREKEKDKQMVEKEMMSLKQQSEKLIGYCEKCKQKVVSEDSKSIAWQSNNVDNRSQLQSQQLPIQQSLRDNNDLEQEKLTNQEQLQGNPSRLMQKMNRSRVHYQRMSSNNLSKKNLVSHFIYDSLQKKSELLEICSNQWQEIIKPLNRAQMLRNQQKRATKMINVTGVGNKKKTIFAGRSFETTTFQQDMNNVTVSSIGSNSNTNTNANTNNDKRKKTKFIYQQKGQQFSIQKVLMFSYYGNLRVQGHRNTSILKNQLQIKDNNKLIEIKQLVKRLIEQSQGNRNNNNRNNSLKQKSDNIKQKLIKQQQQKQSLLQQLTERIFNAYKQTIILPNLINMHPYHQQQQLITESHLSSSSTAFKRQKSEPSDKEFVVKNNVEKLQIADPMYRVRGQNGNSRGWTADKIKMNKGSMIITENVFLSTNDNLNNNINLSQGNLVRNTSKSSQIEKNFQLSRVQSHNMLGVPPSLGTKNSLQFQSSLSRFPQLTEDGEYVTQLSCDRNVGNANNINVQTVIQQHLSMYPKLLKFSQQQLHKLTFTMKDLVNLFIDINTAKNFQYINLFQNDEIKITSTIKIKRNNSLNPTQQQLKKKNMANVLIKKSMQGQVGQGKEILGREQENRLGVHMVSTSTVMGTQFRQGSPKRQENNSTSQSKQKRQHQIHSQKIPIYTLQLITSTVLKHLRQLKKVPSTSNTTQSHTMTIYEKIRNFLRYPHSAVTLANDKQFIQKQRHQSAIEYLQLRKIFLRVFKLHQRCGDCYEFYENSDGNELRRDVNLIGRENIENQRQILCKHVIEFFEKIGVLFYPSKSTIHKQQM